MLVGSQVEVHVTWASGSKGEATGASGSKGAASGSAAEAALSDDSFSMFRDFLKLWLQGT